MNPFFMFMTSANKVVMFEMQIRGGDHHFISYIFHSPPNPVNLTFKDFAYLGEGKGGLIVGQVTSFEDYKGIAVAAAAKSGFFYGFEGVNSCFVMDTTYKTSDETPNPYTAIPTTTALTTSSDDVVNDSEAYTITKLDNPANFID